MLTHIQMSVIQRMNAVIFLGKKKCTAVHVILWFFYLFSVHVYVYQYKVPVPLLEEEMRSKKGICVIRQQDC